LRILNYGRRNLNYLRNISIRRDWFVTGSFMRRLQFYIGCRLAGVIRVAMRPWRAVCVGSGLRLYGRMKLPCSDPSAAGNFRRRGRKHEDSDACDRI
jgi:hypothetical protein